MFINLILKNKYKLLCRLYFKQKKFLKYHIQSLQILKKENFYKCKILIDIINAHK